MPGQRPRVVFDRMIFLQAAARRTGPSGACLALAEQDLLEHYISPAIPAAVQDVISRPQIRIKFRRLADDVAAEFIARIERIAIRVDQAGADIILARQQWTNRTSIRPRAGQFHSAARDARRRRPCCGPLALAGREGHPTMTR